MLLQLGLLGMAEVNCDDGRQLLHDCIIISNGRQRVV
jgi:hypothetical protein